MNFSLNNSKRSERKIYCVCVWLHAPVCVWGYFRRAVCWTSVSTTPNYQKGRSTLCVCVTACTRVRVWGYLQKICLHVPYILRCSLECRNKLSPWISCCRLFQQNLNRAHSANNDFSQLMCQVHQGPNVNPGLSHRDRGPGQITLIDRKASFSLVPSFGSV